MNQQTSTFPTLSDSGMEAIAMNKRYAVAAIARVMKKQEASMWQKVEDIWG